MKRYFIFLLAVTAAMIGCQRAPQAVYQNPIFPKAGPDPWALYYDGMYYYMHTCESCLKLWVTPDITDVKNAPCKTIWQPTDSANMYHLWAPEIHRIDGKWYVYFAADDGNTDNHQMYVLENGNANPFDGEFVMKGRISTDKDNNWAIDGSVFECGGALYMVWSGWQTRRVSTETQCIYIARMENPWTLSSERVMISKPELAWERHWQNDKGWTPPYTIYVNEGPQPLLSPNGKYIHIAYSASGCWTPYYALGLLTASVESDLLDPASWQKSPQPVFRQKPEAGVYGTGHNSFFQSPDGKEYYILYHARSSETDPAGMGDCRTPRMQSFTWDENDFPVFGEPYPTDTVLPKPSGTPSIAKTYQPAGEHIFTKWGEEIDPKHVWEEYPRPQMVRERWENLNGLWQYAIREAGASKPKVWDGEILVPFCVESALSGVGKSLPKGHVLWYERRVRVPRDWCGEDVLLHFGAVDWKADVYVNGQYAGSHTGGYTPFTVDMTPYLRSEKEQVITVRVEDSTDDGFQPRGKQVRHPNGIWYTAVSGIWQTVWMEPVCSERIARVVATTEESHQAMRLLVDTQGEMDASWKLSVRVLAENRLVAEAEVSPEEPIVLPIENPRWWSPDSPFLYDLDISLKKNNRTVDHVRSYAAMRYVGMAMDKNGYHRMLLNGQPIFHFGLLDQGWWPDGLYTAPSDEALRYDIQMTKDLGFNMIRKHVKVEPARWYYHCDRMGVLVWQDMPSGDLGNKWEPHAYVGGTDRERTPESVADYYAEWEQIMDFCMPYASVCVWVPFNEAWGQFATEQVSAWTKQHDPSRLVNPASGGNFVRCGDILDLHNYPQPAMYLFDPDRVNVLGEYGGIGLPMAGHLWANHQNWGYIKFGNSEEVTAEYMSYARMLAQSVHRGLSAAVYTQTTDVEGEVNGLLTYDRKVLKMHADSVRNINQFVIRQLQ